ncbi:ferritin-like fold-containing protein [Luteimicrobium sp. DT211]|uniref:ferritin-like fold-containing protein n=1 Tax=Luteimicrobium sp. DT211 TaxID=3393412 RepID=UPI003CEA182A
MAVTSSTPPAASPPPGPGDGLAGSASVDEVVELLGLVGAFELDDVPRFAAEAADALDVEGRLAHARRAGVALAGCERVLTRIGELGASPVAAMTPFDGAFADFDARTPPSTWEEEVLREFVGRSVAEDFCRLCAPALDPVSRDVVLRVMEGSVADEEAVQQLAEAAAADRVLSARLALWGRRLVGEALRLAQSLLTGSPTFLHLLALARAAETPDDAAPTRASEVDTHTWALRQLTERHALRMRRLGLTA